MKILILIFLAIALYNATKIVRGVFAAKPLSLEEKLAFLESCGLKLATPFTVENLLESWTREDYESDSWSIVLTGLGMTEEQPPWRPHCENLWLLDHECIAGPGDYASVVKRMTYMAGGALPVTDIADQVDLENEEAWFSFKLHGNEVRVEAKVKDDWLDSSIFGTFIDLLKDADPNKVYVTFELEGQNQLVGCLTRLQLKTLNKNKVGFVELK